MRPAFLLAAAIAALPFAARAASHGADVTAITKLLTDQAVACNAKDIDGLMKPYITGSSLFVFDAGPPTQHIGFDDYRADNQGFLNEFPGKLTCSISAIAVVSDGHLGYSHQLEQSSGTDTKGQVLDLTARVTDVYQKTPAGWRIVQEHVSFPYDFKAKKVVLDSK